MLKQDLTHPDRVPLMVRNRKDQGLKTINTLATGRGRKKAQGNKITIRKHINGREKENAKKDW
jgi:hypothetical protein